jgi:hypothetical protein
LARQQWRHLSANCDKVNKFVPETACELPLTTVIKGEISSNYCHRHISFLGLR